MTKTNGQNRTRHRQQRRAAYHEAGHVVVRSVVGLVACPVEIHADGSGIAHGTGLKREVDRYGAESLILMSLAGPIAEARAAHCSLFEVWLGGGTTDIAEATQLLARVTASKQRVRELMYDSMLRSPDVAPEIKLAAEQSLTAPHEDLDHYNDWSSQLVREYWPAIERVARALLRTPRLEAAEVRDLVGAA